MARRIVVCCDGTWNTPESETNVHHTFLAASHAPSGAPEQAVFYDPGVGTGPGWFARIAGGAFGWGLSDNVKDGYRFIVEHYREPDDEIYLFGFSRGAYTARSIAGMVRCIGIAKAEHVARVDEAYRIYRKRDTKNEADKPAALRFREEYAHDHGRIRFLGVWDTVGSLGVPGGAFGWWRQWRYGFHDVKLSSIVDVACHAVAIDEQRKPFRPTLWTTKRREGQIVKQLWFPGVHSDVGGGYRERGLANVTLHWLIEEAKAAGLRVDQELLATLEPDAAGRQHDSYRSIYRLLGRYERPIAPESPGGAQYMPQELHGSATERLAARSDYRSPNLIAYLADRGEWPPPA